MSDVKKLNNKAVLDRVKALESEIKELRALLQAIQRSKESQNATN